MTVAMPIFSVIIPVYNVENYLSEALESIIGQDGIDFDTVVEILLINDGSTDGSGEICEQYAAKYPENIIYIYQENAGLAAARNRCLDIASGQYVSFLDPDDRLSSNVFVETLRFFERCATEGVEPPAFAAMPIHFFEANDKEHPLNYKFKKYPDVLVFDAEQHPDAIVLSGPSSIFRRSAIGSLRMNSDLHLHEDARFVFDVLESNGRRFGSLRQAIYYYRKRIALSSKIDTSTLQHDYYFKSFNLYYKEIINSTRKSTANGSLSKNVQHIVMYDMQWHVQGKGLKNLYILNDREKQEYTDAVHRIIKNIDPDVIFAQRSITFDYKMLLMDIHFDGSQWRKDIEVRGTSLYLGELELINLKKGRKISIYAINSIKSAGLIRIEGMVRHEHNIPEVEFEFRCSGKSLPHRQIHLPHKTVRVLGVAAFEPYGFMLDIPTDCLPLAIECICTTTDTQGKSVQFATKLAYTKISRLHGAKPAAYRLLDKYTITANVRKLNIAKTSLKTLIKYELKQLAKRPLGLSVWRIKTIIKRLLAKKEIWLFCDRTNAAGDNAEALYDYVVAQNNKSIKPYFLLKKSSPDFERLQAKGYNLVPYGSNKHKSVLAASSKTICSDAPDFTKGPWSIPWQSYLGLCDFDFVFLQHGITNSDISGWINSTKKNIRLFVTTSTKEQDRILADDYGYDDSVIKLLGFPRYDKLTPNSPQKRIAIMPTWRKWLTFEPNPSTGVRPYNHDFAKSEYFRFYQRLLNDKALIQIARQEGYGIDFYLHPSLAAQISDFVVDNDTSRIKNFPYNYSNALSESALLLTDYSSVYNDFAYLRKPIIFTMFDYENLDAHTHKPNPETLNLGPQAASYDATVNLLIEYILNGCKLDDTYRDRINKRFAFHDRNNCKRVYHAILEIG